VPRASGNRGVVERRALGMRCSLAQIKGIVSVSEALHALVPVRPNNVRVPLTYREQTFPAHPDCPMPVPRPCGWTSQSLASLVCRACEVVTPTSEHHNHLNQRPMFAQRR
jgi:hypothetical protein